MLEDIKKLLADLDQNDDYEAWLQDAADEFEDSL